MSRHIDLYCPSCKRGYSLLDGLFHCPRTRGGEEHILGKRLDFGRDVSSTAERIKSGWNPAGSPFRIFRELFSSHVLLGERRYVAVLDELDDRLSRLEGTTFTVTPLQEATRLMKALDRSGRLWIKNDSINVGGSHKARHLMGSLLYLEALRLLQNRADKPVLAIYSCGNAALGAAAIAQAAGYELHAFVPADVNPVVESELLARGTRVHKFARSDDTVGDPCYVAFRRAINREGWIPFSCSGNDNWSNIEGGTTLGWETLIQLHREGNNVTSLIIQVGGGALARSTVQAWQESMHLGFSNRLPKIFACQPEGGFPFVRAYLLVLHAIAREAGLPFDHDYDRSGNPEIELERLKEFNRTHFDQVQRVADFARDHFHTPTVTKVLDNMVVNRDRYMWPWDGPAPASLAHGILDDETYDWYDLLLAILKSGGGAVIVPETTIIQAQQLARQHTKIAACATGTAGLAGLMELQASGAIAGDEPVALFFTGIDRDVTRTHKRRIDETP